MLTKEDYKGLYRIYGSKEGFELRKKVMSELYTDEEIELIYKIDLALFRDKDISKAESFAKQ